MDITWYGHACFRVKDRGSTVITDPYDKSLGLTLPRLKADIVTVSHPSAHHNNVAGVKGDFKVINSPGEYEIGGTFVTATRMLPAKNNAEFNNNNVCVIYLDDLTTCHLGDLRHVPSQDQVEDLGNVDILLVPVGGKKALNAAQAAEVISLIEPYIVIPMHYKLPGLAINFDPVDKFLKEMGAGNIETVSNLKITQSSLPEETQIILMEHKS